MVDALQRKLKVPRKFVPYMEKHHIFDVLYDLVNQLVVEQPRDHIEFLRKKLQEDNIIYKYIPKIIILAPPYFDKVQLSTLISASTGARCISLDEVKYYDIGEDSQPLTDHEPAILSARIRQIIDRSAECLQHGWILFDYPRNRDEAMALQSVGVLPTHTLQFFPSSLRGSYGSSYKSYTSLLHKRDLEDNITMQEGILEYRRHLLGLRDAYKLTLKEVEIGHCSMEQLAEDCCKIIRMRKHCGAPMLPRVLLIGPKGSGRKTQANLLSFRYSIIHVDFKILVERTKLEDNDLGKKVRLRVYQDLPIENELLACILEKRILERDCLDHGWVLTGYPENVVQFELLDRMDTPPNRVIFLDVEPNICYRRITNRYFNKFTGSQHDLLNNRHNEKTLQNIVKHPKDVEKIIYKQINHYLCHMPELLKYSRGTETRIDGSSTVRTVKEKVHAVIIRPPPDVVPRDYVFPEVVTEVSEISEASEILEDPDDNGDYGIPIAMDVVNEIFDNVIAEGEAVDEVIDECIERVIDKVDHSHIDSVLHDVLCRTLETAKKQVHYDVEHECLAIVRGIPHSKHTYRGSEYGRWVIAQENARRKKELAEEMSEIDSTEEEKTDTDFESVALQGEIRIEDDRPRDSMNPLLTHSDINRLIFYKVKGLEGYEMDLHPEETEDDVYTINSSYMISTAIVEELIANATEEKVIELRSSQCHIDLQNTENDPTVSDMEDISNEIELNSIGVRLDVASIPSFRRVSLECTLEPVLEEEELRVKEDEGLVEEVPVLADVIETLKNEDEV